MSGLLDGGEAELVSAMNGSDGLQALKQSVFDLVLVDYQLPDMLGLEILEWMRDNCPETPKVFVTGFGTIEVAVKAMKLGAADLFIKPIAEPPAFVRFLNRTLALDPPLGLPPTAPRQARRARGRRGTQRIQSPGARPHRPLAGPGSLRQTRSARRS